MTTPSTVERTRSAASPRLLLVEDEISTMFAIRGFFSFNGYRVDCAASSADAMLFLQRRRYDAVITDLHLTPYRCGEGMNVLERARRVNPAAVIVMLTAYASDGCEDQAYKQGATLFETKPVGLAKLAARIEAARDARGCAATPPARQEWGPSCRE